MKAAIIKIVGAVNWWMFTGCCTYPGWNSFRRKFTPTRFLCWIAFRYVTRPFYDFIRR